MTSIYLHLGIPPGNLRVWNPNFDYHVLGSIFRRPLVPSRYTQVSCTRPSEVVNHYREGAHRHWYRAEFNSISGYISLCTLLRKWSPFY